MRIGFIVLACTFTACFSPSFTDNIACGPGGACPDGLTCGPDNVCRAGVTEVIDAGVIDAPPPIDAPPDAPPVGCTVDADCQDPADPCATAGTCNTTLGVCDFGALDCSTLDGECTRGVCDGGTCVAMPANEDSICGEGVVCGAFSACDYTGFCDSTAQQSRTCTRNTCEAGTCAPDTYTETSACTRVTENLDCQADTVTDCGACGYSSTCDENGPRTCQCTDFKCHADVCTPATTACSQPCTRDTDGAVCASPTVDNCTACNWSTVCDESASQSCQCSSSACVAGSCSTTTTSCQFECSREMTGEFCACSACGPDGEFGAPRCCSASGSCTDACGTCGSSLCEL